MGLCTIVSLLGPFDEALRCQLVLLKAQIGRPTVKGHGDYVNAVHDLHYVEDAITR